MRALTHLHNESTIRDRPLSWRRPKNVAVRDESCIELRALYADQWPLVKLISWSVCCGEAWFVISARVRRLGRLASLDRRREGRSSHAPSQTDQRHTRQD